MIELIGSYTSGLASSQARNEQGGGGRSSAAENAASKATESVSYNVSSTTGGNVLEIVDTTTGNVIRQIPTPATVALRELQNELVSEDYDYAVDLNSVVGSLQSEQAGALADDSFNPYLQALLDQNVEDIEAAREFQIQLAIFYSGIGPGMFSGSLVNTEA